MSSPRRLTVLFIALAISSLSCGVASLAPREPAADAVSKNLASAGLAGDALTAARALSQLHTGLLPAEVSQLSMAIARESERVGLPIDLVLAVIRVESSGYNFAVSHAGAMGLMQLLPSTAESVAQRIGMRWVGPSTLFEPVSNVRLGIHYLQELVGRYGSVTTALAAYNWGPTRIAERIRRGESIPVAYAQRVMGARAGTKTSPLEI